MPVTLSKFDQYKFTTRFNEGYCEHTITCEPGTGSDIEQFERGVRIEKWTKGELIDRGAFGTVWLQNEEKGGVRAVKQIPKLNKALRLGSSKVQALSSRELQALTEMNAYPQYFVEFFGWYEDTENIYFAMEYISSGNLMGLIGNNGMAESDAKTITTQLLKGLEIMHENKFCHRDLKPENILVVSRSPIIVKISDFGVSKQSVNSTVLQSVVGTSGYIAPEVWGYQNSYAGGGYDSPVDIWSLGCLIHAILTTDTPFDITATREFIKYAQNLIPFPTEKLVEKSASQAAIRFITSLMMPLPEDRLTAKEALKAAWLNGGESGSEEYEPSKSISYETFEDPEEQEIFWDTKTTLHQCTTLSCAITHKNLSTVRRLCRWGQTDMREGDNTTLLHRVFTLGSDAEEISRLLLEKGADIMARDELGWTALHHAAKEGHVGMARLLLEREADIKAKDGLGWTALHRATKEGHQEMIKLLIEKGADLQATEDGLGSTALHMAVKEGNLKVVELLLSIGANARVKDNLGDTPLHIAVVTEHEDSVVIMKLLIARGAIMGERNKEGKTPLSLAPKHKGLQKVLSDELMRFFSRLGG